MRKRPATLAETAEGGDKPSRGRPQKARVCAACNQPVPLQPGLWPHYSGKPYGEKCSACSRAVTRNALTVLRDELADVRKDIVSLGAAEVREISKRLALRTAHEMQSKTGELLALLLTHALDPDDPHHQWAMQMAIERVAPARLFAEIGAQAAGATGDGGRPTVTINITPATPPTFAGNTITVSPVTEGASE